MAGASQVEKPLSPPAHTAAWRGRRRERRDGLCPRSRRATPEGSELSLDPQHSSPAVPLALGAFLSLPPELWAGGGSLQGRSKATLLTRSCTNPHRGSGGAHGQVPDVHCVSTMAKLPPFWMGRLWKQMALC